MQSVEQLDTSWNIGEKGYRKSIDGSKVECYSVARSNNMPR